MYHFGIRYTLIPDEPMVRVKPGSLLPYYRDWTDSLSNRNCLAAIRVLCIVGMMKDEHELRARIEARSESAKVDLILELMAQVAQ